MTVSTVASSSSTEAVSVTYGAQRERFGGGMGELDGIKHRVPAHLRGAVFVAQGSLRGKDAKASGAWHVQTSLHLRYRVPSAFVVNKARRG